MNGFKELFEGDITRYGEAGVRGWERRWLFYFRKSSTCKSKMLNYFYRFSFHMASKKRGIEVPHSTSIGKGLYIGHAYNITVNGKAKLGENINIHKGVTIGQENR